MHSTVVVYLKVTLHVVKLLTKTFVDLRCLWAHKIVMIARSCVCVNVYVNGLQFVWNGTLLSI